MNIWQLSLRYLSRKKVKTIILFIVFLTIGTSLVSLMSIRHSLEKKIIEPQRRNLYLSADSKGLWPQEAVQAFKKAKVVKHIEANRYVSVPTDLKLVENPQRPVLDRTQISLLGYNETSSLLAFKNRQLKLVQGNHLQTNQPSQVLVPQDLAEKNHLKVGQKLTLAQKEVEVAGIFAIEKNAQLMFADKDLPNTLLVSEDTVAAISGKTGYKSIVVSLDHPKTAEGVLANVKKWSMDWTQLKAQNAADYYGDAFQNVKTLDALLSKLLTGLFVLSTLLLVLMLTFWINNRIRETGILLSVGLSKKEVILHYFFEVLMVALIAFLFSIFLGGLMGQGLADHLMSQVNGGLAARSIQETNLIPGKIDVLAVSLGFRDAVGLYVRGILISFLAIVFSSYSIVRLQPKQILSKIG